MATAEQYAQWLVTNESRKGTPEFNTVAEAYKAAKQIEFQNKQVQAQHKRDIAAQEIEAKKRAEPKGIGETISGVIEPIVSVGTGLTTGAVGQVIGTGGAMVEQTRRRALGETTMTDAEFQQYASKPAQALTYEPKTQSGKENLQEVSKVLEPLQALGGATAELQAISELARLPRPQVSFMPSELPAPVQAVANAVKQPIKTAADTIKKTVMKKSAEPLKDIGELAGKAAKGDIKATEQLAREAKVNPEALKSAEDLGIDLPVDVYSENELLRQTAGLTRSKVGEESAAWKDAVQNAADKADEAIQSLGGAGSKAEMSQQVSDTLNLSRNDLKMQSKALYEEVDSAIPKSTIIEPTNIKNTINDIIGEVGVENLSAPERQLLKSISGEEGTTYGALLRLKSQVGDALSGKQAQNPFGSVDTASLKRLYGAIKQDQIDNVGAIGGEDLSAKLHFANRLTQKQKALEDRIVASFGKEGDGSIAVLMDRAINSGAKGDIAPMTKLLKVVPKEMHKDVIATALSELVRSQRNTDAGMFDFGRYAKTYSGLMRNRPVYNMVIDALGKDKAKLLQDLQNVSVKVNQAKANVKTTGAGMQQILEGIQSNGLMSNIIQKSIQHGVNKIAGGMLNIEGLFKQPADTLKAFSELLRSQEFKDLAVQSATKPPKEVVIKRFINSKQFKQWANEIKKRSKGAETITNPHLWVIESINQNKNNDQKF